MNPSRTALGACLALAVLSRQGLAIEFEFPWIEEPASFEITETLVLDFHDDNLDRDPSNDRYGDVRNRLNLKLGVSDFLFAVRLDTTTFFHRPPDSETEEAVPYLDHIGLEKISGSYNAETWRIDLGDFYASVGRGIALQIRKTDELSEDTTLLGARWGGELGSLGWTALAGLSNPTNTDGVTEKTLEDAYDLISALEGKWRPGESLAIGAHGVWIEMDPLDRNTYGESLIETSVLPRRSLVAGASLELLDLSGIGSLVAEFDWLEKQYSLPGLDLSDGWAAFAGGTFFAGDWTFTAEIKAYSDYSLYTITDKQGDQGRNSYTTVRLDYIRPPTLEPEDIEVDNNTDVTGARLGVAWHPADAGTVLSASYAGFWATDPLDVGHRWIYNASLGAEQRYQTTGLAKLDLGLREEVPDWRGGISQHLIYLRAAIRVPVGDRHGLELHGTNWWVHERRAPPGAQATVGDFLQGEWTLGYSWSPWLSLSVICGYDTEASRSRDLDVFLEAPGSPPLRQVFLAGGATINLGSRVLFKLLGGQLRGGTKCINGVCRYFPPFAGVRLETVLRF